MGLVFGFNFRWRHLGRGDEGFRIEADVTDRGRPVELLVLGGDIVGRTADGTEKSPAHRLGAKVVAQHRFKNRLGVRNGVHTGVRRDVKHHSQLLHPALVGLGIINAVLLERGQASNIIDQFLVADVDVETVRLAQKQELAPGFLGHLRRRAGLPQLVGLAMDGERIACIVHGVVKIGHGKILTVDPTEIIACMTGSGREQVARVSVEKKSEADNAQDNHQNSLRLAAKKLHHNAATLLKTTGRENMIVA